MADETYEGEGILEPHEHDVLSGRGNFVNYHAGNEHFRALVRKYKTEYVKCPKPQKGKFSRIIVHEIRAMDPPGRFLKQNPSTKLWHDIGEKKSLDKTRQALREGAPDIIKEMSGESGDDDDVGSDDGQKQRPIATKKKVRTVTETGTGWMIDGVLFKVPSFLYRNILHPVFSLDPFSIDIFVNVCVWLSTKNRWKYFDLTLFLFSCALGSSF
jgi:hypothetical protein